MKMGNQDFIFFHFQKLKKFFLSLLCCFPTYILALLILILLSYNGVSIFCIQVPFPAKISPESNRFSSEIIVRETTQKWSTSSSSSSSLSSSSVMYSVKEEIPDSKLKTHLPFLQKTSSFVKKSKGVGKNRTIFKILKKNDLTKQFSVRVKEFFHGFSSNSSSSYCKLRFFMTWISSLESFGNRELFTIQSVFKSHPNACLLIISNSMDSTKGFELLKPFKDQGFRVSIVSPDFDYIFKNTLAQDWFDHLRKGMVDPGEVSLGQNLSNLLRLVVLYKFGGIYIDSDIIILKNFSKLRNTIGAQTIDLVTRNWSRLNNAVLIFDKKHPLLYKFIEEFALTFNGNIWGHNGPYLVSRVVSRLDSNPGFKFTILPPQAFYPVDWSRIQSLFRRFNGSVDSKWYSSKLRQIRQETFAVHLWNKQSRKLKVEEGSIIDRLMADCCIFCNSSFSAL